MNIHFNSDRDGFDLTIDGNGFDVYGTEEGIHIYVDGPDGRQRCFYITAMPARGPGDTAHLTCKED